MSDIDLTQSLTIGSSIFGFKLGASFDATLRIIDPSFLFDGNDNLHLFFERNITWKLNKYPYGLEGESYEVLSYSNDSLQLVFNAGVLTDVILGGEYKGNFWGIRIGDQLPKKIECYEVFFNDQQDEFLLRNENGFFEWNFNWNRSS
ncbi:hypothetical protein [Undibacterium curvum]|uniref:Galectin n=1 Tax=Undibacterium curvum TaxID=2762294 RepID=A0ABR7A3B0_9BURK|nr:hypothetical protein [Undibacterium curvum]MBC3931327.1 hypothetical protein [Undibacterium curvum]